jgi:hypothetical protein
MRTFFRKLFWYRNSPKIPKFYFFLHKTLLPTLKPNQAKPSQAKPSQAKPSQAKPKL